jgi:hypothetical protein
MRRNRKNHTTDSGATGDQENDPHRTKHSRPQQMWAGAMYGCGGVEQR